MPELWGVKRLNFYQRIVLRRLAIMWDGRDGWKLHIPIIRSSDFRQSFQLSTKNKLLFVTT